MTARRLTRIEAVELIEEVFNLDSSEARVADDVFEIVIPYSSPHDAGAEIHAYCSDLGVEIDPDSFEVVPDTTEDPALECVQITIRTGGADALA